MSIDLFLEDIQVERAIVSFSGWPDAGKVAQHTLAELGNAHSCQVAASWDLDGFWHVESLRPRVEVHHGQIRKIDWPTYHFSLCNPPVAKPFLIGTGPEPTSHWQRFIEEFLRLLKGWGCKEVILLGSFYDHVYHDEIVISGVTTDAQGLNQIRDLGCEVADYQGPGAVNSAVIQAASEMALRCVGFWAHFPFYLNAPHELLVAHMLGIAGYFLGCEFDTRHLLERWSKRAEEIEELIEQDSELQEMLEAMRDEERLSRSQRASRKVVRFDDFLKRRSRPLTDEE